MWNYMGWGKPDALPINKWIKASSQNGHNSSLDFWLTFKIQFQTWRESPGVSRKDPSSFARGRSSRQRRGQSQRPHRQDQG